MDVKDFKYGFRFTDEKYSLFPDEELAKIIIADPEDVKAIWDLICDNDILELSSFVKEVVERKLKVLIDDCRWGEVDGRDTCRRLNDYLGRNGSNEVIILYDSASALKVSSDLFAERWSDFCYPSDALLIKCAEDMLLYYEDTIYIAERK